MEVYCKIVFFLLFYYAFWLLCIIAWEKMVIYGREWLDFDL